MAGIPTYPRDWAVLLSEIERRLRAVEASAQTRVGYTGGTLTGSLDVQGGITTAQLATALLNLSGNATIGGNLGVTGDITADDITGNVVTAAALVADALTLDGDAIDLVQLALALDPPGGAFVKGGGQSIANTTQTTVTGLTWTAPAGAAGRYTVTGAVLWANDPDGRREASLTIGGIDYPCVSVHSNANTPIWTPVAATGPMNAGQTATISVWHSAGAALDVLAGTRLEAVRVGPL